MWVGYTIEVHKFLFGVLSVLLLVAAQSVQAQTVSDATTTQTIIDLSATTTASIFDPLDPSDVEARVRAEFNDIPVMIDVARCESGFRQFDDSGNPLYGGSGGMVGVFQEAASIHSGAASDMGFDINTLDGNLKYARHLYDTEGTVPWLASASCWNPSPVSSTLKLGSSGKQVMALQKALNRLGYLVAKVGDGSPGHETSTFGPSTQAAVRHFQCDVHIICSGTEKTSGYGMVGLKTKLALQKLDAKTARAGGSGLSLK